MTLWGKRGDMIVHESDPYNAEPPPSALVDEPVTPLDTFYSRNHGPIPEIDPDSYRLVVDGLVRDRLELSLTDLAERFEQRVIAATLQCAGNRRADLIEVRDIPGEDPWSVGATSSATWTGVSLADVLDAAGLDEQASYVAFEAPDVSEIPDPPQTYGGSLPREKALAAEVLLATAMNGEPLPRAHGAPVRVVVPGFIGARSVKWVQRITAQREASTNYFQHTAYRVLPPEADPSAAGPGDGISLAAVSLTSAIVRPEHESRLSPGPVAVAGYALAGGGRSVTRVDVSQDGGRTWRQADLTGSPSPWVWRLWQATVELDEGSAEIVARAWDDAGMVQPERPETIWNPKGYNNTSWARITVEAR